MWLADAHSCRDHRAGRGQKNPTPASGVHSVLSACSTLHECNRSRTSPSLYCSVCGISTELPLRGPWMRLTWASIAAVVTRSEPSPVQLEL